MFTTTLFTHCGGWYVCVCVCFQTHAEVSVPDLDAAILAAGCYQLPITAVGATCGCDLLSLEGARFEHALVLLLRVHVPCAHSAVDRQRIYPSPTAMNQSWNISPSKHIWSLTLPVTVINQNHTEIQWDPVMFTSSEHEVRQLCVQGEGLANSRTVDQSDRHVWSFHEIQIFSHTSVEHITQAGRLGARTLSVEV